VSDAGWDGVTLYLGENFSGWTFDHGQVTVLAGTLLMDLIRTVVEEGLGGMELLAGIPGGVGGALRMNAGAFGQEIQQVITSVSGFRWDGSSFYAPRRKIAFMYRQAPELDKVIITAGHFCYEKQDVLKLKTRMEDILALRAKKQPLNFPSCGSVFKRPAGYYAGALIEEAGLKGERIGDALISPKHAGFILNTGNAKAAEVYALIRRIENRVIDRFGVQLEREVKLVGNFEEVPV
jgi:UDP-N-acetylmuramate dehydrogenase